LFLEVPLQLIAGNNGYWFNHSFQSLFYWKYHFNSYCRVEILHSRNYVSILVLLEVPLQQSPHFCSFFFDISFNPCFTGSTTSTVEFSIIEAMPPSFNPCFTGSTTSTKGFSQYCFPVLVFQSLFYWKYHFNCEWDKSTG